MKTVIKMIHLLHKLDKKLFSMSIPKISRNALSWNSSSSFSILRSLLIQYNHQKVFDKKRDINYNQVFLAVDLVEDFFYFELF